MTCKKCNAQIPEGAAFCPACGAAVSEATDEKKPIVQYCPKCGIEIPDGENTCPKCSKKEDNLSAESGQPDIQPRIPEKKRKIGTIAAGIIVVLLLICSATVRMFACLLAFLAVPVSLVLFIVCHVRKKPKKKWGVLCVVSLVFIFLYFSGTCSHEWIDATCTAPKTCSKCEKTEGESLGHSWEEATCTEPKTCSRCGLTEGEALGHTPGEWKEDEPNFVTGGVWLRQYCQVCEQQIDSKLMSLKSLHENGVFLFSPNQFSERLSLIYKHMSNCDYKAELITLDDGTMGTGIISGNQHIGSLLFTDSNNIMNTGTENDTRKIASVICTFNSDVDIEAQVPAIVGMIAASNSSLEISDATDVAKKTVLAMYSNNTYYEKNGIKYLYGNSKGEGEQFIISVLNK